MESRGYGFDEDHPRVCGEKRMAHPCLHLRSGSPPRMRGKACFIPFPVRKSGITPAYAGKRAGSSGDYSTAGDHPRVCGEKKLCPCRRSRRIGSPPRMRGKAESATVRRKQQRITPAYAGKSTAAQVLILPRWDHPRVCGEKFCPGVVTNSIKGSPPRMRGKD